MCLNIKWRFYLALKYLFPTGKRISFLSIISILGVALGVIVLFVVNSVMNGFQSEICTKIVNTQGEIRIDSSNMINNASNIYSYLKKDKDIEAVSAYIMGILMLQFDDKQAFPIAKGIKIIDENKVVPLTDFIKIGQLENLDDDSIIISSELAKSLGIQIGDSVDIYSPLILQDLQNEELTLPKSFKVIAIYSSGWNQVDSNLVIFNKRAMQELYGLNDDECHGFSLKLHKKANTNKVVSRLKITLPNLRICGWQEINEDFLFVLKMEKAMMMFVLFFILLVASFSIASSLMISVVKKRREIGLLCAFGATPSEVAKIFILEGFVIGSIGSVLGFLLGTIALSWRNSILAILTKLIGVNDLMLQFYDFAELPVKYSYLTIVIILSFTILICCLAGLIPALAVTKIKPSDALRNE